MYYTYYLSAGIDFMLKTEPLSWIQSDINHLTKIFKFQSNEKLTEFIILILKVEHSPGDPHLEAIPKNLSMKVSVDLFGHSETSIHNIINKIDNIFIGCINGKNNSFWGK